jgi:DNA replication and repair protein RecF
LYLKKLELKNYRNYSGVSLNFDKNTVLILGNNGNGKTNLLESIYYLSTGRSHRTYTQDDIIKWGCDSSIIRVLIGSEKNDQKDKLIEIELSRENNIKIRIDGVYHSKKSDFISILPSVIFSPDDLKIVKSGPLDRRNFLDSILERIDKQYYRQRLQYNKILTQRSSLVKSISGGTKDAAGSTLEVWNENIVKYGTGIIEKRSRLLTEFRDEFKGYVNNFFKGVVVDLFYIFSWDRGDDSYDHISHYGDSSRRKSNFSESELKDIFRLKLKQSLEKDLLYRTTTVGPHRDDFVILLDGKNLRSFGSQGQQRAASISLKLCELNVLKRRFEKDPVFLLDDVFSELDIDRKKVLVKVIGSGFQTFVTATNISYLDKLDLEFGNKFLIEDNKIAVSGL